MSVNSQKYIIQNIESVAMYDLETGVCDFVADDLQEGEMTNEQETVYATGKNGVKIGSADRNKASRFTATNGAIVDGILAAQVGSEVETGKYVVPNYIDAIRATADGTAVTTYVAKGTTGAEIKYIYKKNVDGTLGDAYTIGATASATEFAYAPATKTITLPTDVFNEGDEVIAIYDIEVENAKKITNSEDKFSKTGKVVFDIFAKDICSEKSYYGKIVYPKGKASGNFSLAFGNEPSTQNLEIEALSGGCTGGTSVLWDMYIFDGEDIVDVVSGG